jgi:hypothetical protein
MYYLEGQPAPYLLPAYSCVVFGRRFVGESVRPVRPADDLVTRTRSTTAAGKGRKESSNHYKRAYCNTKSIPPTPFICIVSGALYFEVDVGKTGFYLDMLR